MRTKIFEAVSVAALAICLADAACAAEAEPTGDDIIVTGERIARTLEETASSVAVTTNEELRDRAGSETVNDVLAFTPNISIAGKQNNGPTIRGQNTTGIISGVDAFLGGSRPRTTILVDGRPLSFNEFIFGQTATWDIAQVEIFLGPQTTSQGPNSIAGLINVRTNDPVYKSEAAVRASYGNYDTLQLSGMVNVPIVSDQVALRVAADYRKHESFVDFSPAIPYGRDPEKDNFTAIRAKLMIEPEAVPGLRALITYNYADSIAPQVEQVVIPASGSDYTLYPYTEASIFAPRSHTGIVSLSYDVSDRVVLANRTSYTRANIKRYSLPGSGTAETKRTEWTSETTLNYGRSGDSLFGVAGLYYQHAFSDEFSDLSLFGLGNGIFTDKVSGLGLFGELTASPFERLSLTGGLRYQRDRQNRDGGFTGIPASVDYDRTFEQWLPKFGLAYDVSEVLRIGLEARRGYNPGGVTLSFLTGVIDTFEAERLWNYEFYWRARLLDGKLRFNGNLFYADYENAQRPVRTVVPGIGIATVLDNVEDARSYGAELQVDFAASKQLTLQAGLGLLKTEIRRATLEPTLQGNDFERAPGVTATIGARVEPIDGLVVAVQGRYSDGYFSDDLNSPALRVGSYFIGNAQISYQWGPARLFASATNVFDKVALLQRFGNDTANVSDPREYNVGIEFRF